MPLKSRRQCTSLLIYIGPKILLQLFLFIHIPVCKVHLSTRGRLRIAEYGCSWVRLRSDHIPTTNEALQAARISCLTDAPRSVSTLTLFADYLSQPMMNGFMHPNPCISTYLFFPGQYIFQCLLSCKSKMHHSLMVFLKIVPGAHSLRKTTLCLHTVLCSPCQIHIKYSNLVCITVTENITGLDIKPMLILQTVCCYHQMK